MWYCGHRCLILHMEVGIILTTKCLGKRAMFGCVTSFLLQLGNTLCSTQDLHRNLWTCYIWLCVDAPSLIIPMLLPVLDIIFHIIRPREWNDLFPFWYAIFIDMDTVSFIVCARIQNKTKASMLIVLCWCTVLREHAITTITNVNKFRLNHWTIDLEPHPPKFNIHTPKWCETVWGFYFIYLTLNYSILTIWPDRPVQTNSSWYMLLW
jgi:hypothetical protein